MRPPRFTNPPPALTLHHLLEVGAGEGGVGVDQGVYQAWWWWWAGTGGVRVRAWLLGLQTCVARVGQSAAEPKALYCSHSCHVAPSSL